MTEQTKGRAKWRGRVRKALRWTEHGFAAFGLLVVIYYMTINVSVITSGSMKPTLQGENVDEGDWVVTERISYRFRDPDRWEVAAIDKADGLHVMKRVVGLPGEKVSLVNGHVCIDGREAPRPESLDGLEYLAVAKLFRGRQAECGDGYFVLGDDTRDSQDSRFEGPVERRRIVGRVWLRIWPPRRIGWVNP
jgi:signal peptidase I